MNFLCFVTFLTKCANLQPCSLSQNGLGKGVKRTSLFSSVPFCLWRFLGNLNEFMFQNLFWNIWYILQLSPKRPTILLQSWNMHRKLGVHIRLLIDWIFLIFLSTGNYLVPLFDHLLFLGCIHSYDRIGANTFILCPTMFCSMYHTTQQRSYNKIDLIPLPSSHGVQILSDDNGYNRKCAEMRSQEKWCRKCFISKEIIVANVKR